MAVNNSRRTPQEACSGEDVSADILWENHATDRARRVFILDGATLEEFCVVFLHEFLPADYESRMQRELKLRTQAPDELVQEYVRTMEDLFLVTEPQRLKRGACRKGDQAGTTDLFGVSAQHPLSRFKGIGCRSKVH